MLGIYFCITTRTTAPITCCHHCSSIIKSIIGLRLEILASARPFGTTYSGRCRADALICADVSRLPTQWDYYRFHKLSDLRVSIAVRATEVAFGSPSRTLLIRSGDSKARWIRNIRHDLLRRPQATADHHYDDPSAGPRDWVLRPCGSIPRLPVAFSAQLTSQGWLREFTGILAAAGPMRRSKAPALPDLARLRHADRL